MALHIIRHVEGMETINADQQNMLNVAFRKPLGQLLQKIELLLQV